MFVKICGLTNLTDTLSAYESGASAAGFNFYPGSPRYIAPESLAPWIERVPTEMWKVGVFVNESPARVLEISRSLGLDIAQLHGSETPADVPAGMRVWKAARVSAGCDFAALDAFPTEALLLDGPASGIPFDWDLAKDLAKNRATNRATNRARKIVLAGGLDIDNVCAAIDHVQPWGVDICSRIESAPGKKDLQRMKQFIETVMSC
jgi:phosphoribosylanthranilate isomerase